jgi:hypothetical protein
MLMGVDQNLIFFGIVMWIITLVLLVIIIRSAVDGSETAQKINMLVDEIRMLRDELKSRDE